MLVVHYDPLDVESLGGYLCSRRLCRQTPTQFGLIGLRLCAFGICGTRSAPQCEPSKLTLKGLLRLHYESTITFMFELTIMKRTLYGGSLGSLNDEERS